MMPARFEHFTQPVLPIRSFLLRLAKHGGIAGAFLASSLAVGIVGYRYLGDMSWLDAFLNASMILTGMGPVSPLTAPAAKVFAGFYALYSGVAFLSAVGILFAPVLHRLLHRLHLGR